MQVGGRRAYAMARAGEAVDLPSRQVEIKAPRPRSSGTTRDPAAPDRRSSTCAARPGTYVRALARDLGARLGCGAYLGALVRTASGPFTLDARPVARRRSAMPRPPIRPGWRQGAAAALGHGARRAARRHARPTAEIADALQGRFVRPGGRAAWRPGRRAAAARRRRPGCIVGMGRRDGARVAPTKMLPR